MFFKEISDDLLVCLYREGNQAAKEFLYDRFKCYLYGFINDRMKQENIYKVPSAYSENQIRKNCLI